MATETFRGFTRLEGRKLWHIAKVWSRPDRWDSEDDFLIFEPLCGTMQADARTAKWWDSPIVRNPRDVLPAPHAYLCQKCHRYSVRAYQSSGEVIGVTTRSGWIGWGP